MTVCFETLVANALVATLLGAVVAVVGRWLRPAVLHVLWLIVLLKLVTPPLVRLELPTAGWWATASIAGEETAGNETAGVTAAADDAVHSSSRATRRLSAGDSSAPHDSGLAAPT